MGRLTKRETLRTSDNKEFVGCNIEIDQMNSCPDCNDSCMYGRCKWQEKANRKLKEYEDLEEQGLLLKLPVAEGDTVYKIITRFECDCDYECEEDFQFKCEDDIPCKHEYEVHRVMEYEFHKEILGMLGKTIFLTKAEAENALAEMGK